MHAGGSERGLEVAAEVVLVADEQLPRPVGEGGIGEDVE